MDDFLRGFLRALLVMVGIVFFAGGVSLAVGLHSWPGSPIALGAATAGLWWARRAHGLWR